LSIEIKEIENVTAVSATSFDNALLIGKTNSSYAVLRNIQIPDSEFRISDLNNPQSTIAIGKDLAQKTGLQVGDTAEIVSGNLNSGEIFAPVSTSIEVAEIFSTGLYEYDASWILVSASVAARLTGKTQITPAALEVKTDNIYNSIQISKLIQEKLGSGYKVLDWQEANRPLFAALSLERLVGVLTISLIVFVAALNITTALALVVGERKSDIAVLKTCGARSKSIISIFLLEGAMLGIIGILLGVSLGLAACFASNYFGLIKLPPDVYSINQVSLKPNELEILLTIAATFLLCLTASAIPALMAAKVKPMENLN
jgi:lipoprotein-releasing system permease protein